VSLSRYSLTLRQKSTLLRNKLDSAIARLDRLCLRDDDDDDELWDEDGDEQRAKLFKSVFGVNYHLPLSSFSASTLRLIRDAGNVLYHRITAEGYKESQDDVQVVSGIAEEIRDALLDYQVCSGIPYAIWVQLNRDTLTDDTTTGDIRPELPADCESHNLCFENGSDVYRGFQDTGSVLRTFFANKLTYMCVT